LDAGSLGGCDLKKNNSQQDFAGKERFEIKSLDRFTVIGVTTRATSSGENKIPALWDVLLARADEIHEKVNLRVCFGVERNLNKEAGVTDYLAGFSVNENSTPPAGMEKWHVPAQTYVVFPCTLSNLRTVYSFIYDEFLPNSPFVRAGGPEFEYYDENFSAEDENSTVYLYTPVKKR
jgi:predicted transcriptional regulator YdeE